MTVLLRDYTAFDARRYLDEYYAVLVPENVALLRFLVECFAALPPNLRVLDFGGGPCLYTSLVASRTALYITHAEYLAANRREVEAWRHAAAGAFDWRDTIRTVLRLEGAATDADAVATREMLTRAALTSIIGCDLRATHPLLAKYPPFDVLATHLCLEAVASDLAEWRAMLARVVALLKPNGTLIMTAVRGGNAYTVGENIFPVLKLHDDDIHAAAGAVGLQPHSMTIRSIAATHDLHPYDGLMFITARRAL
jgi:hypothetical protein